LLFLPCAVLGCRLMHMNCGGGLVIASTDDFAFSSYSSIPANTTSRRLLASRR
jgi:hypothetical protein